MQQIELELSVGDVVRIDNHWLTVVELDGDEVLFRLSDSLGGLDDYGEPEFEVRPR